MKALTKIIVLLLVQFLASCEENIEEPESELLFGYWEVNSVDAPNIKYFFQPNGEFLIISAEADTITGNFQVTGQRIEFFESSSKIQLKTEAYISFENGFENLILYFECPQTKNVLRH